MNRYARGVSLGILLALWVLVSACAGPQAGGGRSGYSQMPSWSYVGTSVPPFWWYTKTKIGEMHAHGKDGNRRTVAILDSGFLKGHEDVAKVDPLGVEVCSNRPTNDFDDVNGHGTALAGITLGRDKGAGIATAGAAPQAMLFPVKVVCGVSNAERIRQGVQVAIDKKVDVVLVALGPWPSDRDSGGKKVHERLLELVPAHPEILFVVASVWDDSTYLRPEWTKAGNVVLAAAMTLDNAGTEIVYSEKSGDIWAPGRDVETASIDVADRRQHAPFLMQGTSAAAAILAGCAAAIKDDAESGTSLKTRLGRDFVVPMPNGKARLDCSRGLR
jgi:subtilisin family serine protease